MMRVLLLAVACVFLPAGPCAFASEPTSDGLYAGFSTSLGEFWCRLEFERAPRTVANFVGLVEGSRPWIDLSTASIEQKRFYDGLTFHRVVDKFIIQGGSPNGRGTDGPGYLFADEFHAELKHSKAGVLSMANSGKNSNGSQFFITVTNTPWLDGVHSIFGSVVDGMETVFTISKVPANTNSQPLTPVIMNQVRILRRGAAAESFDPAKVVPPLPDVGQVPISLRRTSNDLELLFQSRAGHLTYIFVTSNFSVWGYGVSKNSLTNLLVSAFLGAPYQSYSEAFFHSLDGGFEP